MVGFLQKNKQSYPVIQMDQMIMIIHGHKIKTMEMVVHTSGVLQVLYPLTTANEIKLTHVKKGGR
jgi:hypothetical protein